MKKTNWLPIWLIFVAASYLIPWWNRVYFLWDDIELLMQLRHPTLSTFLASHQYQFFPIFKIFYASEIQLFGVNPSLFLLTSVILHLTNIILVYKLIVALTKNHSLGLAAAILVSFNKSYFTVIFWPTIQSNLILTTFLLLAFRCFFILKNRFRTNILILFTAVLVLGGLSFGFGVGAGFVFATIAWIFWQKSVAKTSVVAAGIIAGIGSILGILLMTAPEIQKDQIFQLSLMRIFNIVYFTSVGVSQAVISRFLLPGFIPNIHSPTNITVMIALPAIVLAFFTWGIIKNIKNKSRLAPLFLFATYTVIPYFIAALARSGPGALGGLAERYIYPPFFFFILALVYGLYLVDKQRKFPLYLTKLILPGAIAILSLGQQIIMHLEVSHLFLR